MAIGVFGGVVFETSSSKIETFNDLNLKSAGRWAKHEVIGSKAKNEYLSPDLLTISFKILLSAYLNVNVKGELSKIRDMVENGDVNPLIIGSQNLGKFKINSATEAWKIVDNRGEVQSAEVSLDLEEYV